MSSTTLNSTDLGESPHSPKRPRQAKSSLWRLPLISLILGTVIGGIWYATRGHKSESAAAHAETTGTEAVQVDVVHPKKGGIARVSAMTGSVHAFESADLFAKVSGYLKSQEINSKGKPVPVDIGLHVKRGDVLAEIEDPEMVAAAEQASAELEQARSQVVQATAHVETAVADKQGVIAGVTQAEADVGRYTAKRNETQKAYSRFRRLQGASAVQEEVVEEKQDAYESAVAAESSSRAAVITAKALVAAAKAKVDQAEADLTTAKASVRVAEAKLKKAQVMVSYTKIVSPYNGVVTLRSYHVGDFIRSASEGTTSPLLTVARTDVVRIVTKVADKDVPYVDVGDPAVVTLDALPGQSFAATVSRFTETEDPSERTMRTEIDVKNESGKLREGMYGLATITLQPASDHLTLPSHCLSGTSKGDESAVYVIRNGHAHLVPVSTGADDGVRVEILSGLKAEDEVIVPNGAVGDGTAVVASNTTAAPAPGSSGH